MLTDYYKSSIEQGYKKPSLFTIGYILSFKDYSFPKSDIDRMVFGAIEGELDYLFTHPKIDLSRVVDISYQKESDNYDIGLRTFFEEKRSDLYLKKRDNLKSGMVFGKEGVAYKFVLPLADRKIINIMEIGVEPDQVDDIYNMTVSAKARYQVIIPLD